MARIQPLDSEPLVESSTRCLFCGCVVYVVPVLGVRCLPACRTPPLPCRPCLPCPALTCPSRCPRPALSSTSAWPGRSRRGGQGCPSLWTKDHILGIPPDWPLPPHFPLLAPLAHHQLGREGRPGPHSRLHSTSGGSSKVSSLPMHLLDVPLPKRHMLPTVVSRTVD